MPGEDLPGRFEQLYRDHFGAIYAYALRRSDPADVHDLVAEVFATAWRRMPDVPAPPEDRLWLYGVAWRTLARQQRTDRRRHRLVMKLQQSARAPAEAGPYDRTPAGELVEALRGLRPENREVVRLIVWEQLTHAEVALVLGCSANAVAIRWHRALRRLRRDLGVDPRPHPSPTLCAPPPIAGEER